MRLCLLTGAKGFIGQHVTRTLLDEGWRVITVSRNTHNDFSPHENHEHIALDLHDPEAVETLLKSRQPSHLIHLAWEATPGKFWYSRENFRWVSSSAMLLDAFVRHGGEKAVLAGSCAEYKWENSLLDEETSPLNATTFYSASKLAFKGLAEVIARDIPLVWARIFFPYGPDEDDSKLISYIFREISKGRIPQIQTPNRAVDMIHVSDVARAFERLAASEAAGTINICSGTASLPHEIALECAKLREKPSLAVAIQEILDGCKIESSLKGNNERMASLWTSKAPLTLSEGLETYLKK
ncbi:NAD(P)-dependent oxidoreductase [uncultured Sneathiella sp.]|uniref:NAD-dependent epimerase/dehydratase family protein n=1 Tax=uncultured Sneathiella sp. TaxID=879315 RepID=UPI0030EB2929|tara:strand:- start:29413 stop:30303 length:891 start_codon:yes stop_codon:yes gene_type:complete